MKWKNPPTIKIYEALGAIADNRIEITHIDKTIHAKVYSSSKGKWYDVKYDEINNAIMSNDNSSYRNGYLGYPAIALLIKIGKIPTQKTYIHALKNIMRKDINTKNKNDFDKTIQEVDLQIEQQGIEIVNFKSYLREIENIIDEMNMQLLGEKTIPPKGY